MKTFIDCIPCFLKQAIEACRMINLAETEIKKILDKVACEIPDIEMSASPPVMARTIHRIIKEQTGNNDPYKKIKKISNDAALEVYPDLKKIINDSENKLLKAVEIAIAGNIIDYGAIFNLNVNKEIKTILESEEKRILKENSNFFAFNDFKESLKKTKYLLYLADNAGEIVFDRILIEEIKTSFPDIEIYCAVRGKPIINDCLIADAEESGIDKISKIISNGEDYPGTVLEHCSKEFLKIWNQSDLIISKGQGNFESLCGVKANIFYMFIVKCQVLARDINCSLRDIILCRNP
jgi:damage-control phosphatase, subfamily I